MNSISPVRPSPIAGSWYSADAHKLSSELNRYLDAASLPNLPGRIVGLIAPHAGYVYSGPTAAYAYRAVRGLKFDLCVVVSPLHQYLPYSLITSAHKAYTTPLGNVEIDLKLVDSFQKALSDAGLETVHPIANDREHSLEIQLPFLQCALSSSFKMLPLMVRSADAHFLQQTALILSKVLPRSSVLLVASTDLSHFYNESSANQLDAVMLSQMSNFSAEGVLQAEEDQTGFACGSGAVALVLWLSKFMGAEHVTLLHHDTSASTSGDHSSVVGYGSLAITTSEGN